MPKEYYKHIILQKDPEQTLYTSLHQRGEEKNIPKRNRQSHSGFLMRKLEQAWKESENEQAVYHSTRSGVYLEFKSDPGADLITKSLEVMRSHKVRLLNVRTLKDTVVDSSTGEEKERETTYATVYVANEKRNYFFDRIEKYANEIDSRSGKPKNYNLVNSIGDIRKALLIDSFWQDNPKLIPETSPRWCEVWLSNDTEEVIDRFERLLEQMKIESKPGKIRFPERTVKVIKANKEQLEQLTRLSDDIAEYRRAKETAEFWTSLSNKEQAEWVKELLERLRVNEDSHVSVCILDTGVNNGHPLISPLLNNSPIQG